MSKVVDERVVSMQFDNKNFEQNVSTTMSTLDKLKAKLNLSKSAKGLEDIGTAAKKVDLSSLGDSATKVGLKFNGMYTMADQAFRNMYNSAERYAKRIVSAFTIDPIKTGFQEYETQINAVQTILANTESKGTTLDDVNNALDTLNAYADKTIYNFTEMTKNIGTFTAAGVDLNTSVDAIQGIANLAAVSGSTSQQAATAMYQLSQALSSGTVKLMDWNSVVNAGMGGEVFQNALKETARIHGVAIDDMIKKEGSFRETLSSGWLTSEILTDTLKKFTLAAEEGSEQWNKYKKSLMDDGYTEAQAEKILKMANTATDAATKVKTFTQLFDTLKEAAQSGWTQSWEILIGDFEEAKELFTGISNFLGDFIKRTSETRNKILEGVFGKTTPLGKFAEKLQNITGATEDMGNALNALKDPLEVVDSVIRGDWGNTEKRWNALTEAGYDWAEVQNLVNERLGSSVRHVSDLDKQQQAANKTKKHTIEQLVAMSDAELKALGFTKAEIQAFRELQEQSKKTGIPIEELVKNIDQLSGRELVINSFKNSAKALGDVFKAIGQAWKEIFPDNRSEEEKIQDRITSIYNVIAAIHKYTTEIKDAIYKDGELTEKGENLVRTFKGLFAILDIVTTITGGAFKIAFKVLTKILGTCNIDLLEFTAIVGDVAVKVRDWFDSLFDVTKIIEKFGPLVKDACKNVKEWFNGLKDAEDLPTYIVDGIVNGFKGAVKLVGDVATIIGRTILNKIKSVLGLKSDSDFFEAGGNIVQGLADGVESGFNLVGQVFMELGRRIIEKFKEVLGIHSPSVVFMTLGGFIIAGLIAGLQQGKLELNGILGGLADFIILAFNKVVEFIKDVDLGHLLVAGLGTGIVIACIKMATAISNITAAFEGLGEMMSGIGGWFKARTWNVRSTIILKIAISIGILAASLALLSALDSGKLWGAVGALSVLVGLLAALSFAAYKLEDAGSIDPKKGKGVNNAVLTLIGVAASLLLLAIAMKKLSDIDADKIGQTIGLLIVAIGGLMTLAWGIGKFINAKAMKDIDKAGIMMTKMSVALLLMVAVVKLASMLDGQTVVKGIAVIASIELLFMAIIAVSKRAGEHADKAGKMLLKMSFALLIMVAVIKLAGSMDSADAVRGLAVIAVIEIMFAAIIAVSKLAGEHASTAGSMILKMALAIGIVVLAVKLASTLDGGEVMRASGVIALVGGIFAAVIAVSKIAGNNADKAGALLLKMSFALLIMVAVIAILSLFDPADLGKAVGCIVILEACFAGLIAVTKIAKSSKTMLKTLTTLIIIVGVLAGIVVGLSFIDPSKLGVATAAISTLIVVFGLLMAATKLTKNTAGTQKSMLTMLGVVAGLAAIVVALSFIDAGTAIKSCAAIAILLGAMSTSLVILGVAGKISKTASKQLPMMLLVVAGLAAILGVMSALNVEASIPSAIAIGILANALAASLIILGFAGKTAKDSLMGVLALTAMAIPLLAFVGVLAVAQNIQNAMTNVKALTVLATAMTLLLIPLMLVGVIIGATGGLAALGIAALLAMAIPLIAFVGVLAVMQNVQNATENTALLINLLNTMTAVLTQLAIIGPFALIGVTALASLTLLMGAIGLFAVAIGALMTEFPQLEEFLNKGIPIMEKLAYGIGSMVGNLISGFATGLMTGLPEIGRLLSEFWTEVKPFVDGVKTVDEQVLLGVGVLAAAILALTVADLINGVTSFLTGSSFVQLGTELTNFWNGAKPFIDGVKMIDASVIDSVKTLAEAVLVITAANIVDSIANFISGGETSMATFGSELGSLGAGVSAFYEGIKGLDEDALVKTQLAADVIKTMAEASNSIPASGGWLQKIVGENSLGTFGTDLANLGSGLKSFSDSLVDFDEEQKNKIIWAAEAVKEMALVAQEIPATDGWLQVLVGENSLAAFGEDLKSLGSSLRQFVSEEGLGDFTEEHKNKMIMAAEAVKEFATVANEIPATDGWVQAIVGENSLAAFGEELKSLGACLKSFVGEDGIGDFTEEHKNKVIMAAEAVKAMADVATTIPDDAWWEKLLGVGDGKSGIAAFGEELKSLGSNLNEFAKNLGDFNPEQVSAAATAVKTMADAAKVLVDAGLDGEDDVLYTFGSDLAGLGGKLHDYAANIAYVDTDKVNAVSAALLTIVDRLKRLKESGLLDDSGKLYQFGSDLAGFGGKFGDFNANVANIDSSKIQSVADDVSVITDALKGVSGVNTQGVDNTVTSANKLVEMFKGISGVTADSASGFVDAIDKLAKANITALSNTFKAANKTMTTAGENLIKNFITGVSNKKSEITNVGKTIIAKFSEGIKAGSTNVKAAFITLINACVASITGSVTHFYNAGANLVKGFASGISQNTYRAKAKAKAMAAAAADAAKKELDEHSPSKVGYEIGDFFGVAFVNGISDNIKNAYNSSSEMATSAKRGLNDAISRLAEAVDSDMDFQPTIKPVVDLSNVRSGANAIGSMLSDSNTLSVDTRTVGVISASMSKVQNGNNSGDIVSAIKALRKDLADAPRNTYSINGISYDDGSAVGDAVSALARAIRLERRT